MNARRATPSAAEQALAAFGDALAVFGATAGGDRALQWCSPALAAQLGAIATNASWRAWTLQLDGLAAGAAVAEAEGAWNGPAGASGHAQLRLLPGGGLALRLQPAR